MKLNIPEIGDELILTKPWNFRLYVEYRNLKALKSQMFGINPYEYTTDYLTSLPPKTILKIDRIYIRKGNSDYSSITFWAKHPAIKNKQRFWVKLEDANNIEFDRMVG